MNSTQAWVTYLSKVELPVLANTLRRINELTDSRNSTVNELANVILNDARFCSAMTAPICCAAWPGQFMRPCRPGA